MTTRSFEELIETKRDGGSHSAAEIDQIILSYAAGDIPDYQMSAWIMAAFINGLNAEETVLLTDAMVRSGRVMDLSSIDGPKVDKHSTGGVGDTATLVLAPLLATCGVSVAKMSGRGLGHSGGTLDKLESIPGFRIELGESEFIDQVCRIGVAVIAQSPEIDPADKKMYALRDVTATIPSIPLIVGSIISKKVAGGADAVLLDVKVGSGAFMKTESEARALAAELVRVGEALGKRIQCELTDMNQPLGCSVGNALEVAEAIRVLRQDFQSSALWDVCLASGSKLLVMAGVEPDLASATSRLQEAADSGAAVDKMRDWIAAQGGDSAVVDDTSRLPSADHVRTVTAREAGYVSGFDAEGIGRAAMLLGAGRASMEDSIDPGAGLVMGVRVGDAVDEGCELGTLYASDAGLFAAAEERFHSAIHLSDSPVDPPPLFHDL